jgi:hypothetical protein
MGVDTLMITFMKERETKNHNRKQEEGKIRLKQMQSALDVDPAVLSVIERVLEYVLVAGIVGGDYSRGREGKGEESDP